MKLLALITLAFLMSGCAIVGPGKKAVHTVFGNPTSETGSGITFWVPFIYGLEKFDLRVQNHVIETTAASKDLQPIDTHLAVNWRIDPNNLTGFYKDVGDGDDAVQKIIQPAVNEVVKSQTAKFTAEEVVSRRAELKKGIDAALQDRFEKYGLHLDEVSIVDLKFSADFTRAIEQKQIAEQQTKQAEYLAQKAENDAKAEVNRAKGQAEAQRLLQSSLTQQMLQKLALDKWDGHFPQVMGQQTLPFLNIGGGK
jgi:prohibitin 1